MREKNAYCFGKERRTQASLTGTLRSLPRAYPWLRMGTPVKIVAGLTIQIEVATKSFAKCTPRDANRSSVGARRCDSRAKPGTPLRWSSARMNSSLGRSSASVPGTSVPERGHTQIPSATKTIARAINQSDITKTIPFKFERMPKRLSDGRTDQQLQLLSAQAARTAPDCCLGETPSNAAITSLTSPASFFFASFACRTYGISKVTSPNMSLFDAS